MYKRIRRSADGHYAPLIQDHYFDQSHFLKAFKQFAGVTPRVYSGVHDYGLVYIPDYLHGVLWLHHKRERNGGSVPA